MLRLLAATALCALLGVPHSLLAAATRTHVASSGNDANAAFSCDYAHPCRTFAVALANTTPGGEILAIDSSGYGKLVIDRSVSIVAAPGVFAGIGVGAGGNATGVAIATAGVNVVLRGLTLTGQGGTSGIDMSNGAGLSVENCDFSNFTGAGVTVSTPASVRIVDSLFRDNDRGATFSMGATTTISGSRFLGNTTGGIDTYGGSLTPTTTDISDSFVTGGTGLSGILASSSVTGAARVAVTRSTVSNSHYGIYSYGAGGGSSTISVSETTVTGNDIGLLNFGATGTLRTAGNNAVAGNGVSTSGTITATPTM